MNKLVKKFQFIYLFYLVANISLIATLVYEILTPTTIAREIYLEEIAQSSQPPIMVKDIQGFKGVIKALTMTPDGKILLVGAGDATLNAVDLELEQVVYSKTHKINDYSSIVVTSQPTFLDETTSNETTSDETPLTGPMLALADDENIRVLSLVDGSKVNLLKGHSGKISDLALSPDDKILVSVSASDRTIRIWDFATGNLIETLGVDIGPTNNVAFTPDGMTFVTGAIGDDRTLKFWDLPTLELIRSSPQQPGYINDLKITPDGKKLVAAVRNYIKVWDLTTGKELLNIKGPRLDINAIAISPDSRVVATANKEGNIMLFDLTKGRKLTTLEGHKGWVLSLVFSPDGRYLYSGAEDKIIKIWQLRA